MFYFVRPRSSSTAWFPATARNARKRRREGGSSPVLRRRTSTLSPLSVTLLFVLRLRYQTNNNTCDIDAGPRVGARQIKTFVFFATTSRRIVIKRPTKKQTKQTATHARFSYVNVMRPSAAFPSTNYTLPHHQVLHPSTLQPLRTPFSRATRRLVRPYRYLLAQLV